MSLEPEEKVAGRLFRVQQQQFLDDVNADEPPTHWVPHVLALLRHRCPARDGRSTALELREVYIASDKIVVESDGGVHTALWWSAWWPGRASVVDTWIVQAGRFGFLYRDGRCRSCQQTARSQTGRLVDGWDRPPLDGRVLEELTVVSEKKNTVKKGPASRPPKRDRDPAPEETLRGPTYINPNEDETYVPPGEEDLGDDAGR